MKLSISTFGRRPDIQYLPPVSTSSRGGHQKAWVPPGATEASQAPVQEYHVMGGSRNVQCAFVSEKVCKNPEKKRFLTFLQAINK